MLIKEIPSPPKSRPRMHELRPGQAFMRDGVVYITVALTLDDAHDSQITCVAISTGRITKFPKGYEYTPIVGEFCYSISE